MFRNKINTTFIPLQIHSQTLEVMRGYIDEYSYETIDFTILIIIRAFKNLLAKELKFALQ